MQKPGARAGEVGAPGNRTSVAGGIAAAHWDAMELGVEVKQCYMVHPRNLIIIQTALAYDTGVAAKCLCCCKVQND